MARGTVNLPHGTGKTARVSLANGDKADAAREAGADYAGDDMLENVQGGLTSTPSSPPRPDGQGRLARSSVPAG